MTIKKESEHPISTQALPFLEIGPTGSMHLMLKDDLCSVFWGNEKENKATVQAVYLEKKKKILVQNELTSLTVEISKELSEHGIN